MGSPSMATRTDKHCSTFAKNLNHIILTMTTNINGGMPGTSQYVLVVTVHSGEIAENINTQNEVQ